MIWLIVNRPGDTPPPAGLVAKSIGLAAVAGLAACQPGLAPSAPRPPPVTAGSSFADRASAIGASLSERLAAPARLDVQHERSSGAWTFACGRLVTPAGGPVDYAATTLARQAQEGILEDRACALVERTEAGYEVRELSVGDTDAPFVDWPRRHGIADEIISTD